MYCRCHCKIKRRQALVRLVLKAERPVLEKLETKISRNEQERTRVEIGC
jgi:hypothetical protein